LTLLRTEWHVTHLGGIIQRGPGLVTVEATAVTPEGRITPEDSGLWSDSQIEPLRRIVEFAHSQGQHMMIQLGHAGRKASTVAPWLSGGMAAPEELGGWPEHVLAPSAIPFSDTYPKPKEMTKEDIESFKQSYVAAVKRALDAGFDAIEIHNAHGYLLHEFLSGATNHRTDEYGGSFENRIRLTLEIVDLVRQTIPETMPLFLRISATDWLEESGDAELQESSWKVAETIKLAKILAERGVDILDVSSGGNHPQQKINFGGLNPKHGRAYQSPFAFHVKEAVGDRMAVSSVGSIDSGSVAEQLLQDGLDLIVVGRGFQKNPGLVFAWADELKVTARMPNQIRWAFQGRGKVQQKEKN
jgi:2,4-dienoyl-CoA reductase-like NADH-dependent reductase (Old Yellow Enzyme family)